jgi:pimeloyl-ACP methyl ester carboxylesterase
MKRTTAVAALAALIAASLTGCSAEPEPNSSALRQAPCPDDVAVAVLAKHSCGYVDRSDGSSVFVLRVSPPEPPTRVPVVITGTDLGTAPDYGGLAPVAQRTGREAIIVDLPGVGHSTPLLTCPSVDGLSSAMAEDAEATTPLLVEAIGVCRSRFDEVVDAAGSAAALHDVVTALALHQVAALSTGTTGRIALSWAAAHPGDLEALVLDSPLVTQSDPIDDVDHLLHEIALACADQRGCRQDHPRLDDRWRQALDSLKAEPLEVTVEGVTVRIDDEQLRRAALWVAGGTPRSQGLPDLVEEAARRVTDGGVSQYAAAVVTGPPLCVGHLPKCAGTPRVAVGAVLSLYCPMLVDDPTWQQLCQAWGAKAEKLPDRVTTPTLVLTGRYDPFAPPDDISRILSDAVPNAFYVEDPAGGHNVLGDSPCVREVRTSWLNGDPAQPPHLPACMDTRVIPFPPSPWGPPTT